MATSRSVAIYTTVLTFVALMAAGVASQCNETPSEDEIVQKKPPYEAVEEIYLRGSNSADCDTIAAALKELRPFLAVQEHVPTSNVQTVTLPRRMIRPLIADLAIDRTMRLETHRDKTCQ